MSRGMHKGPRNTRTKLTRADGDTDKNWSSEKDGGKSSLERRIADFHATDSTNQAGGGLLRHRPGSNKK